jgi:hypothetical protein
VPKPAALLLHCCKPIALRVPSLHGNVTSDCNPPLSAVLLFLICEGLRLTLRLRFAAQCFPPRFRHVTQRSGAPALLVTSSRPRTGRQRLSDPPMKDHPRPRSSWIRRRPIGKTSLSTRPNDAPVQNSVAVLDRLPESPCCALVLLVPPDAHCSLLVAPPGTTTTTATARRLPRRKARRVRQRGDLSYRIRYHEKLLRRISLDRRHYARHRSSGLTVPSYTTGLRTQPLDRIPLNSTLGGRQVLYHR